VPSQSHRLSQNIHRPAEHLMATQQQEQEGWLPPTKRASAAKIN